MFDIYDTYGNVASFIIHKITRKRERLLVIDVLRRVARVVNCFVLIILTDVVQEFAQSATFVIVNEKGLSWIHESCTGT